MKKILMNNAGLKLLSIFIAAILWLIVVNINDPVTERKYTNVPVEVINETAIKSSGVSYEIDESATSVTVIVKAKRSVLKELTKDDFILTADLSNITEEYKAVEIKVSAKRYENQIESIEVDPRMMNVSIEKVEGKNFPVYVTTTGTPAAGYVVGTASADPVSVKVTGPESAVDKVYQVVADVNVSGLSEDTSMKADLKLLDEQGNEIVTSTLSTSMTDNKVTVNISMLQTKVVKFSLLDIKEPAPGYEVKEISFEPESITVAGRESDLLSLDSIMIPETELGIEGATDSIEVVVDITSYLPEGVSFITSTDNLVLIKVLIGEEGYTTIELPVQALEVKNIPDGYDYEYPDESDLKVNIQADADTLNEIKASDIEASINLNSFESAGTYSVTVDFVLPNGCRLYGTVTVRVTLRATERTDGQQDNN